MDTFIDGIGETLPEEVSVEMASNFNFCLVRPVDVERSFSVFKLILSVRHNFTAQNLEYIVAYCQKNCNK